MRLKTDEIKTKSRGYSWDKQVKTLAIHHFRIDHNASCLPPKFCITIVSNFSWVLQSSQEKSKTMVFQNWGVNKVHYGLCENSEFQEIAAEFVYSKQRKMKSFSSLRQ